jgi:hypothetical protein
MAWRVRFLSGRRGAWSPIEGAFTFSGWFNYIVDQTVPSSELVWVRTDLIGQGTASLTYVGQTLGVEDEFFSWRFRSADYQFESAAPAPVPEPGLAAPARRRPGRPRGKEAAAGDDTATRRLPTPLALAVHPRGAARPP